MCSSVVQGEKVMILQGEENNFFLTFLSHSDEKKI